MEQQASRIAKRRNKLGISRPTLARQAGCSPTMVLKLERSEGLSGEAFPRVIAALDKAEGK